MVRLREIPRTAVFAWSPGSELPLVVTGTRAGAVDADFSDETKLEIWELKLDVLEQGIELQPVFGITAESRFYDIAWAPASESYPRGIIAGALENGSLDLWDAQKLINKNDGAHISRTTKHTGVIKSLQFNFLKPQILATAGTKGELYIYDVQNMSEPYRLGTAAARSDDLECVAWNRRVPHILATGGSGGFVTIWDLKTKKASLTLNNQRKAVSAIAWDPDNATKLLTATPDDTTPVILLWDLRQNSAPERILEGHIQGILSLSWCQQDSDLLLSCGKDNRTICWNPRTGENLGEFPEVTNWTFQTTFNPHNPNLSATASFDGKIFIQTLQNTKSENTQAPVSNTADGEDFFTKAQNEPQEASFSLRKAPKWMENPVGASFGYGGKLLSFGLPAISAGQSRSSIIRVTKFAADTEFGDATEAFENALKLDDMREICESHVELAKTEQEKSDWKVIQTLTSESARKGVTEYLGLSQIDEAKDGLPDEMERIEDDIKSSTDTEKKRLSTLWTEVDDEEEFLSNLSAAKDAKTNDPFQLFAKNDSVTDRQITKCLMLGQFEQAMTICLKEDRIADAFIIANCGGNELTQKVQTAYLSRSTKGPSYLRLLASVIDKNLWDIVHNADLQNWRESMATLCTYANPDEFSDLCEALGDRILETGTRKDAAFCYLVGAKLEKVVGIWIDELEETRAIAFKNSESGSSFSIHARCLQNFIEKVTIFRNVTKFHDSEQNASSGWKLSPLYDLYVEYADLVADHGHLATAERYLNLIPEQYKAAEVARSRVKKATTAPVATEPMQPRQQAAAVRTATRAQPVNNYQPVNAFQPVPNSAPVPLAASQYAPPAQVSNNNLYAPPATTNPYAPQQGHMASQQQLQNQSHFTRFGAPIPTPGPYGAPLGTGPPPAAGITTYQQKKTAEQWNDTPNVAKPKIARRSTPGQSGSNSVPAQASSVVPSSVATYGSARATPPPPPKGAIPPPPPRVTSPLTGPPLNTIQQSSKTPSNNVNMYMPPPQAQAPQQLSQASSPATVPRGASPYNARPTSAAGPPPSSRYAPAPAPMQQQFSQPQASPNQAGSQSTANRPPLPAGSYAVPQQQFQGSYSQLPPPNPYTPIQDQPQQRSLPPPPPPPPQQFQGQHSQSPQGQYGQQSTLASQNSPQPGSASIEPQQNQVPPPPSSRGPPKTTSQDPLAEQRISQAAPQGPPQSPFPNTTIPSQSKPATPAPQKYPPGDRSHIPVNAQNLFHIFSMDMQRVSAAAPASFAPQVKDTQKRLNILYDHLNNEELLSSDTIQRLDSLAQALQSKDFETASRLQIEIQQEKTAECGNWMVGVKRLVGMSKVTA